MKISFLKQVLLLAVIVTLSSVASAQVFVQVRPVAPVIIRSVAPSPRHIWVDGDWVWRGGSYQYVNGYWMLPPARSGWVPGHWKQTRRGWVWKRGHWRKW